jgi:hypothetical protein
MQPGKATAHDVAPLVFELNRAIGTRRLHDAKHASAIEALRRCEAAWHRLPAHARAVTLVVSEAGLVLPDGARLDGPGADELAADLRSRNRLRIELSGRPDAGELARLVDLLASEA